MKPTSFSMIRLLREVRDTLKPMAEEKQIDLEIGLTNGHSTAWADRDKVTQVLTNLIGNAVKFTPNLGKVSMAVNSTKDAWLQVSITDTGPGIPPEEAGKIFDEFYQMSQPGRDKSRGSGLVWRSPRSSWRCMGENPSWKASSAEAAVSPSPSRRMIRMTRMQPSA